MDATTEYMHKVTSLKNYGNGYGVGEEEYGGAGYGMAPGRGNGDGTGYNPSITSAEIEATHLLSDSYPFVPSEVAIGECHV